MSRVSINLGLDELALPAVLPGEPLPPGTREIDSCGPDLAVYVGDTIYYDENGAPLLGALDETAAYILFAREAPGGSLNSGPLYCQGMTVEVQTDYLGIDMSGALGGPYPLVWETLVVVNDTLPCDAWRYATRAAAHAGHARVVEAIRAAAT